MPKEYKFNNIDWRSYIKDLYDWDKWNKTKQDIIKKKIIFNNNIQNIFIICLLDQE